MSNHKPRGWAAIDLLRFACALLVVANHFGASLPLAPGPAAAGALGDAVLSTRFAPWAGIGWVGVEIFFVISGYVIACSANGTAPGDFLRRRAQRLLPAAWVCATVAFVALWSLQALPGATLGAQWMRSMLFWPIGQAIDPSYWTLGIEVSFYLMVAALLRGGTSAARIEGLAWAIGGASALFWVLQLGDGTLDGSRMNERLSQLLLLVHGIFFAVGVLLYRIHNEGLSRWRAIGLLVFLTGCGFEIVARSRDMAAVFGLAAAPIAPLLIFALGVGIIATCRRLQPMLGWTGKWAATLGLMTYPLYLLHQQIGAVGAGLFARAGIAAEWGLAAALLFVLALSWAVVRHAEPPLRRWIARISVRRAPRPDIRPSASPSAG